MTFAAVLMDPPWPERGGGQCKRGADRHYNLLPTDQMLPVIKLSGLWDIADNAHLYMWVTDNYLPAGLRLMGDLDFRYVRTFAWVKDRVGLGQYARGQHELMLFGVRGDGFAVRTDRRDISSLLDEPSWYGADRREHSRKPSIFHDLIERRSRGPYVEFFSRCERPGWTSFGNQTEKFSEAKP